MPISDVYSSGKHKQEIGHFANIVKIAKTDNTITKEENELLKRTAKKLNISDNEYNKILENPENYPANPPINYDERIERLHVLTKMIFADGEVNREEVKVMRKIAVALHFPIKNIEKVCDEAIHLVLNENSLEEFIKAIKNVNIP